MDIKMLKDVIAKNKIPEECEIVMMTRRCDPYEGIVGVINHIYYSDDEGTLILSDFELDWSDSGYIELEIEEK